MDTTHHLSFSEPSHFRLAASLLPAVAIIVLLVGCRADLPLPSGAANGSDGTTGMDVEIEPAASLDAAPRVLRIAVVLRGIPNPSTDDVVLIQGEVGSSHLRQLARHDVSKALLERFVPMIAWRDESAMDGVRIVLAPTVTLTEGETYAVASGEAFEAIHLHVVDPDPVPVLDRIWPPVDQGGTFALGVWCGMQPLPAVDTKVMLAPAGPEGVLRTGVVEGGAGVGCVRFEATGSVDVDAQPKVGPPAVTFANSGAVMARLDPRPFALDSAAVTAEPARCNTDEAAFGPGCVVVSDDRLYGRSPEAAWLWAVRAAGIDEVFATDAGDPFVLGGLLPSSVVTLDVAAIDVQALVSRTLFTAAMGHATGHVVLNEVQANPLGPEPSQEWVELVNDGLVSANLGGYVLADIGGETALPDASLPPGGYALVVNETYVEDDELDPPPAAGTLVLRVAKLGLNGLSNSGEPLKLYDTHGQVVSRFPATPKPKAGRSVSRVKPDAPDGIAASFADSVPTPGLQNIQ